MQFYRSFQLIIVFLILFLSLTACETTSVDYFGSTYPPTDHVDVYAAKQNIQRDYTEMGKMILDFEEGTSNTQIQARVIQEAEARGADAVLLLTMQRVKSGAVTDWAGMGPDYWGWWEGPVGFNSGIATTTYQEDLEVTVSLLKYNPPGTVSTAVPEMG